MNCFLHINTLIVGDCNLVRACLLQKSLHDIYKFYSDYIVQF